MKSAVSVFENRIAFSPQTAQRTQRNHSSWVRGAERNAPWLQELVRNDIRKWCACVRQGELVTPYTLHRFPVDKLASRRRCGNRRCILVRAQYSTKIIARAYRSCEEVFQVFAGGSGLIDIPVEIRIAGANEKGRR